MALTKKVQAGLKPIDRRKFWSSMIHSDSADKDAYDRYTDCESKYKAEIVNDIDRTPIPGTENTSATKSTLIEILMRYSCFNPSVGYVQGMNYLVTILFLYYKNDVETFTALS